MGGEKVVDPQQEISAGTQSEDEERSGGQISNFSLFLYLWQFHGAFWYTNLITMAANLSDFPQKTYKKQPCEWALLVKHYDPTQTFHKKITILILWRKATMGSKNRCRASTKKNPVYEANHLKNMLVKMDHLPRDRGEHKKYLKPPPRLSGTPIQIGAGINRCIREEDQIWWRKWEWC